MKLSEFKEGIKDRLMVLKANIIFNVQKDLAYPANNWGNISSTILFTVTTVLYINILYGNIHSVAGYTYNEMLVLLLFFQLTYYENWFINLRGIYEMILDVNKGNLDMLLTKPAPAYFYISTRQISIISAITESIIPLAALVYLINWGSVHMLPINILLAALVNLMGVLILHTISLLASLPVFWLGESQSVVDLAMSVSASSSMLIPLEGYGANIRMFLSTLLPILIPAAFSASILLGKGNIYLLFGWALGMTIVALILRKVLWDLAVRHYTSASS
jgi:ABC-2 type transport system permease protein